MAGLQAFFQGVGIVQNAVIPILAGCANLFFTWGVGRYLLASGHEREQENGKKLMIFGIVAMFFLIIAWAIIGAFVGWAGK